MEINGKTSLVRIVYSKVGEKSLLVVLKNFENKAIKGRENSGKLIGEPPSSTASNDRYSITLVALLPA